MRATAGHLEEDDAVVLCCRAAHHPHQLSGLWTSIIYNCWSFCCYFAFHCLLDLSLLFNYESDFYSVWILNPFSKFGKFLLQLSPNQFSQSFFYFNSAQSSFLFQFQFNFCFIFTFLFMWYVWLRVPVWQWHFDSKWKW